MRADLYVLVACPLGALVALYRNMLPDVPHLAIQTIHSAFRIPMAQNQAYKPPGHLRAFEVLIFDEVSQMSLELWRFLETAISELTPKPLLIFVGDFQQLQPVQCSGMSTLLSQAVHDNRFLHGVSRP